MPSSPPTGAPLPAPDRARKGERRGFGRVSTRGLMPCTYETMLAWLREAGIDCALRVDDSTPWIDCPRIEAAVTLDGHWYVLRPGDVEPTRVHNSRELLEALR